VQSPAMSSRRAMAVNPVAGTRAHSRGRAESKDAHPAPRAASGSRSGGRRGGSGALSEDGLRRELVRVTEAYGALAREYRACKIEWEGKDVASGEEAAKLRAQLVSLERFRREHADAAVAHRSSASSAAAAAEAAAALTEKTETLRRAKDSAERRASENLSAAREAQAKVKELTASAAAGEAAKARLGAVAERAAAAEERVREVTRERESLLDFTSQLQGKVGDSLRAASGLQVKALEAEAHAARVTELQGQLAAAHAEAAQARAGAEFANSRAASLAGAATRAAHLEAVQEDLLRTITSQSAELEAAKEAVADASRDGRRVARLERALEAYRRLEKLFASRTGQGFFGVNGLAFDLGLDLHPASTAAAAAARGSLPLASAASDLADIAALPDEAAFEPALGRFLERLQEGTEAEVKSRLEVDHARERAAWASKTAAAEAAAAGARAEVASVAGRMTELSDWRAAVLAAEDEIGGLLAGGTAAGGLGPAPSDAGDPDVAREPLYASAWHVLPSFASLLPRLSHAVGRMRMDISSALRRRKLAEAEAQDLREELATVRGVDAAAVLAQKVASADVRHALAEGKATREALSNELQALSAQIEASRRKIAVLEATIANGSAEAERREALLSTAHAQLRGALESAEAAAAETARLRSLATLHETRWTDAKGMNAAAFALLAEREAELVRAQARLRTLKAKLALGEDEDEEGEGEWEGESGHGAGSGTYRGPPTVTYAHLRVPNHAYYAMSGAGLTAADKAAERDAVAAAKAAAREAGRAAEAAAARDAERAAERREYDARVVLLARGRERATEEEAERRAKDAWTTECAARARSDREEAERRVASARIAEEAAAEEARRQAAVSARMHEEAMGSVQQERPLFVSPPTAAPGRRARRVGLSPASDITADLEEAFGGSAEKEEDAEVLRYAPPPTPEARGTPVANPSHPPLGRQMSPPVVVNRVSAAAAVAAEAQSPGQLTLDDAAEASFGGGSGRGGGHAEYTVRAASIARPSTEESWADTSMALSSVGSRLFSSVLGGPPQPPAVPGRSSITMLPQLPLDATTLVAARVAALASISRSRRSSLFVDDDLHGTAASAASAAPRTAPSAVVLPAPSPPPSAWSSRGGVHSPSANDVSTGKSSSTDSGGGDSERQRALRMLASRPPFRASGTPPAKAQRVSPETARARKSSKSPPTPSSLEQIEGGRAKR